MGQALGAALRGWTSLNAWDGQGGTARWSGDRLNDCEFVMALGAFLLALSAMAPRCAVDHTRREGGATCGMRDAARTDRMLQRTRCSMLARCALV